eukprot:CCRYP_008903-RB/>CCRYP_008903-RB protein AED:0.01 eAED:0.01 QI:201/1/1/1/1/0.66/3/894/1002
MPPIRKSLPVSTLQHDMERPQVLDSDDEDSVFHTDSTVSNVSGNSFNGRSRNLALCYGDRIASVPNRIADSTARDEDVSDAETDDEIVNPYIMNPFSGSYDRSALLPPSVELPRISARDAGVGQRPKPARKLDRVGISQFDPYSPTKMQQLRSSTAQQSMNGQLLEMEEESIDFFSSDNGTIDGGALAGATWKGCPLTGHATTPSSSSSFSPFPKTRPSSRNSSVEYGERAPLSGVARAYPCTNQNEGFLLRNVKAVFQSASTAVSALQHETPASRNPFGVRTRRQPRGSRWGMISYFRLFCVTMAAIFFMGTMTVVRRVVYLEDSITNAGSMPNELQYEGDVQKMYGRPKSLVLKKMERAKRRWWNKKRGDANGGEAKMEVYSHGQRTTDVSAVPVYRNDQLNTQDTPQSTDTAHQVLDSAPNLISNATPRITENIQVPVIVQTGEDGSLLIKLPPPKMNLEQASSIEDVEKLQNTAPVATDVKENGGNTSEAGNVNNDDDTMYIKLPFTEPQRRALSDESSSISEVDPPLRGASVPSHDHPNLKRRPPKPLADLRASTSLDKKTANNHHHTHYSNGHFSVHAHEEHHPGVLDTLRNEFGSWMEKHGRKYGTSEEKERRFHIWKRNHLRISDKNQKHGPCRMTGKAVFGHNMFSDLAPEEFQERFLNGYRGPQVHDHDDKSTPFNSHQASRPRGVTRRYKKTGEMEPPKVMSIHHTIQRKLEDHLSQQDSPINGGNLDDYRSKFYKYKKKYANDCDWWDVSCVLRWIFGYQYIGGTREPVYDESTYPDALDWRNMGVVSDVHAQGSCGACWAITAVETIESAYAIATGNLLDLAEEEVIACDGSCEMCNGGWPQNAYKYVMKHGGLPIKESDYDGDFLYYLTATLTGESEVVTQNEMASYFAQTCPAGIREGGEEEGGGSGSRDNKGNGSSNSGSARYGNIKVRYLLDVYAFFSVNVLASQPDTFINILLNRVMVMQLIVAFVTQMALAVIATIRMRRRQS